MNTHRYYFILFFLFFNLNSCDEETNQEYSEPAEESPYYLFTPRLINTTNNDSVLFEFRIGYSGDYILETDSVNYVLYDNGLAGDREANDLIYSCYIRPSEIITSININDINKPLIGHIATNNGYMNIQAEIWDESIGAEAQIFVKESIQKMSHIVNIVGNNQVLENIDYYIKKFYDNFPDEYTFVNIIFDGIALTPAYNLVVQNNVLGIGLNHLDNAKYSKKLESIIIYPNMNYFDGASNSYNRFISLRWAQQIFNKELYSGFPYEATTWPLSDLLEGVIGYSLYPGTHLKLQQENENWKIQLNNDAPMFNDLELYLMGLIPKTEVNDHFIFQDLYQVFEINDVLNGPVSSIKIDDIISVHGERVPNYQNSPKEFRVATIIITRNLLNEKELSFYNYLSKRAELEEPILAREGLYTYQSNPFFVATGGRAKINAKID